MVDRQFERSGRARRRQRGAVCRDDDVRRDSGEPSCLDSADRRASNRLNKGQPRRSSGAANGVDYVLFTELPPQAGFEAATLQLRAVPDDRLVQQMIAILREDAEGGLTAWAIACGLPLRCTRWPCRARSSSP